MRLKWTFVAAAAVMAALAAAPRPAVADWWPWTPYRYYGYDPAWGYYGSLSTGPSSYYVPPPAGYGGYAGPVCAWRVLQAGRQRQLACL